ncbi:MAG: glycine--tRNA ligase, partial [Opitutae bacterium]
MAEPTDKMESIINLCKRRGFVFASSEIYGGLNGFFDYGPLGAELKNNIKQAWWQDFVHRRDDIVGLDSTIIHHPTTWKASGHIDNFTDPLVDCKESKMRYRADQLFFAPVIVAGETIGYVSVLEDEGMQTKAEELANDLKRKLAKPGALEPIKLKDYTESTPEQYALIPSPATGKPGSLTAPRSFNMMFQTNVGAMTDASSVAYLRPETAQGMFVDFKNVVDTGRVKLPFGIAQTGKSFRNEITPRNFIFRSREFEQMELEFFIKP